ncbi:MAG: palmitoyltransferase akr1 [Claussenomyces sp. TS43310]|nr:MAG: palmitoyltransferase akr1 [Claussenomyces sp. TS43310]
MLNGKAAAASPKLSDDNDDVEMKKMLTSDVKPPTNDDIMQLARVGDIASMQKLYEAGTFSPTYSDAEGITPLHWAAINNQYAMCKFLLDAGADINKKGGESVATPAMWAAQRCHYYTVHLLLQYGADPLVTDVQGYNILHLATFEGNIFLLVLLLHQNIPVDVVDRQGHTCLMWSAYKGYPACVDLFLRWGADVHTTDETGFTALHWALVKGSSGCIQKLIEYGSDRFLPALSGKTPSVMADEMKTTHAWHRALQECSFKEDGTPLNLEFPMSSWLLKDKRGTIAKFFFFWPFLIVWSMLMIASHMVVYAGIPLALFVGYALQYSAQQLLPYAPSDMRQIYKTPWLAGIFAGTLFLVGVRWLTTMLPATYSTYPISNLAFGISYGLCTYFYFCAMFYEPGYVPKLGGLTQQKAVIEELLSLWKFDDQNFCVPCMVRMPLRSKHCRSCNRCVAKHDHHCPWVYNCVGVNNHRQFFLYLIFLEVGITLLVRLNIGYYSGLDKQESDECNLLAPALCRLINADSYTMVLTAWATLQLTWVTMLLFVQVIQISRAMTSYENMQGAHHGHGGRAAEAITSALVTGATSTSGAQLGSGGRGPDPAVSGNHHHHNHKKGCFAQWKKILGVDTFVETALHGYAGNKSHVPTRRNPFSRGCVRNCRDFWCDPAPIFGNRDNGTALLGGEVINYTSMYDTPLRMNTRSRRADDDGGAYESVVSEEV